MSSQAQACWGLGSASVARIAPKPPWPWPWPWPWVWENSRGGARPLLCLRAGRGRAGPGRAISSAVPEAWSAGWPQRPPCGARPSASAHSRAWHAGKACCPAGRGRPSASHGSPRSIAVRGRCRGWASSGQHTREQVGHVTWTLGTLPSPVIFRGRSPGQALSARDGWEEAGPEWGPGLCLPECHKPRNQTKAFGHKKGRSVEHKRRIRRWETGTERAVNSVQGPVWTL